MEAEEARKIELLAINKYGTAHQIAKAIEEIGELNTALARYQQHGRKCTPEEMYNIQEEIADVTVMTDQLKLIFGAATIDRIRAEKLIRLQNNMRKEWQHGQISSAEGAGAQKEEIYAHGGGDREDKATGKGGGPSRSNEGN